MGPNETAIAVPGGPRVVVIFDGRGAFESGSASGIPSIRGPEVSLGSHRVGTGRVQSPTAHAPSLGSLSINSLGS